MSRITRLEKRKILNFNKEKMARKSLDEVQREINKAYDIDFYVDYEPTNVETQFINIVLSHKNNFALTNIAFSKTLEEELEENGYYHGTNYTVEDIEYYLLEGI